MATIYMMLGYPGAGKTTTARIIAKLTGAVHLSSDKIRLELFPQPNFTPEEHTELYKEIDKRTKELLSAGRDVIYDANLNRYIHRKEKYDICKGTNAQPKLIWVKTPVNVAKGRALHGNRQHLVPLNEAPEQMFKRLVGVFEEPLSSEPYISIDGTKVSEESVRLALSQA